MSTTLTAAVTGADVEGIFPIPTRKNFIYSMQTGTLYALHSLVLTHPVQGKRGSAKKPAGMNKADFLKAYAACIHTVRYRNEARLDQTCMLA